MFDINRAIAALILTCASLQAAGGSKAEPMTGVYIWGGLLGDTPSLDAFHRSVGFVLDKGFRAIRFTVTPASLAEYGVPKKDCAADHRSGCYLREFLDSPVFDDSRLSLVMVTLHDFTASSHLLELEFLASHKNAILEEYEDALGVLEKRFHNRPVRIVVSNWEGDNLVYCGSTFRFTNEPRFAGDCATRSQDSFADRLRGFAQWIALRDEAINSFRETHAAFDVIQAPEFNNLNLFGESCHTTCDPKMTVFETLRTEKRRALCSYSSYDSVNRKRLAEDIERVSGGCGQIILGELGIGSKDGNWERLREAYRAVAKALRKERALVSTVFLFHAFEPDPKGPGLALYGQDGSDKNVRALPGLLAPSPSAR